MTDDDRTSEYERERLHVERSRRRALSFLVWLGSGVLAGVAFGVWAYFEYRSFIDQRAGCPMEDPKTSGQPGWVVIACAAGASIVFVALRGRSHRRWVVAALTLTLVAVVCCLDWWILLVIGGATKCFD